jgi:hypothetical protein
MSMVSLTVSPLLKQYETEFWYYGLVPLSIFIILTLILIFGPCGLPRILTWEDPLGELLTDEAKKIKTMM